jgi:hypothetical protein
MLERMWYCTAASLEQNSEQKTPRHYRSVLTGNRTSDKFEKGVKLSSRRKNRRMEGSTRRFMVDCTKLKGVRSGRVLGIIAFLRMTTSPFSFLSVHDLPVVPSISTAAIIIQCMCGVQAMNVRDPTVRLSLSFLRVTRLDPVHPLAAIGPFHHINPNIA